MKFQPIQCKRCNDTGYMVVNVSGREAVTPCDQCDYWARKRGEAPGVPKDEQGSRVENFVTTEPVTTPGRRYAGTVDALRQANYWLQGVHPDLYLHGLCGVGKTRLACSLLNAKWAAGERVLFKRCQDLLRDIMPSSDDESEAWKRLTTVPILAIDDVGGTQGSDFARRMLVDLYDSRIGQRLRTIWTSNLTVDELATFLQDDRLTSRIFGRSKVVEMGCKDWRLRQQNRRGTSKG